MGFLSEARANAVPGETASPGRLALEPLHKHLIYTKRLVYSLKERRCYTAKPVAFGRFGTFVRATAWLFLAWTAVDLTVPSLCALDREQDPALIYSSDARVDVAPTPHSTTPAPVHVDDCFCCSHCVNMTAIHALASLSLGRTDTPLPADRMPLAAGYPPYHPPRA